MKAARPGWLTAQKNPRDPNQLTTLAEAEDQAEQPERRKNPVAVELGKLGGKNGDKATAEAVTPKKRQEIARKAAAARAARAAGGAKRALRGETDRR